MALSLARGRGVYDTDGPAEPTVVHLRASYVVTPSGDSGIHTGCGRFCVECATRVCVLCERPTPCQITISETLSKIIRRSATLCRKCYREIRESRPDRFYEVDE